MAGASFDYIVVGAGSAGCAIAHRLSADPERRVLLIESGPRGGGWRSRMPAASRFAYAENSPYARRYLTEPQPMLNGRRIAHPRGWVLGGSSSVNGMGFVRGHPRDYDDWAANGATGWRHVDVLPYFKRIETYHGPASQARGTNGPVQVHPAAPLNPLCDAFLRAGAEAGYPVSTDINATEPEGFFRYDMNVHEGVRESAARAYLSRTGERPNLTVVTGALVHRVVLEGNRAIAVDYAVGRDRRTAHAKEEIVVSAGAFGSPQLLLLSGIGPADEIRAAGVQPLVDLPGVGRNLQDHLNVGIQFDATEPVSLNGDLLPHRMALVGLQWFLFKRGVVSRPVLQVGALLRSRDGLDHPDVQFHFFPAGFTNGMPSRGRHGFKIITETSRPASRGTVRLRSADPAEAPVIDPAYLSDPQDRVHFRRAYEMMVETMNQPAFARYRGAPSDPVRLPVTESEIDAHIAAFATTSFHPCGSCRMGSDALAVVDPALRVRGVERLRVADASIMPRVIGSNLNAPSMMIGERAADLLLGTVLPPETLAYVTHDGPRKAAG